MKRIVLLGLALGGAAFALSVNAKPVTYQLPEETAAFKPGPNLDVVQGNCGSCHSADYVLTQPQGPKYKKDFWQAEDWIEEAGEKHGAFHLSARHRRLVRNRAQARAVHPDRRVAVGGLDSGAHLLEAPGNGRQLEVRSADGVTQIQQNFGDAAHADPADPRKMQVLLPEKHF